MYVDCNSKIMDSLEFCLSIISSTNNTHNLQHHLHHHTPHTDHICDINEKTKYVPPPLPHLRRTKLTATAPSMQLHGCKQLPTCLFLYLFKFYTSSNVGDCKVPFTSDCGLASLLTVGAFLVARSRLLITLKL